LCITHLFKEVEDLATKYKSSFSFVTKGRGKNCAISSICTKW